MSNEFPEPGEEIKRLVNEIESLRADMQDMFRKLSQMEKRLRTVFPSLPKKPKPSKPDPGISSNKSPHELQETFQSILKAVQASGPQGFDASIAALAPEDVIALAIELGVGQPKKTSLKKATDGIRLRVQERIMLGHTRHS